MAAPKAPLLDVAGAKKKDVTLEAAVFAAEVNVVAARRLWPRSLFPPKLTKADKEALAAEVASQQMRPEQEISVGYADERPRPK